MLAVMLAILGSLVVPQGAIVFADGLTSWPVVEPSVDLCWRMGYNALVGPAGEDWTIYQFPDIGRLKAGFYGEWLVRAEPARPNAMEYAQTIRVHQTLSCGARWEGDREACPYAEPPSYDYWPSAAFIFESVQLNPGSLWMIGNEMDVTDWPGGGQDEMVPELYAVAFHDLYNLIKGVDPTAQVAIGGLVQATPLRLQYLTIVWDTYLNLYGESMPVDVWNIHGFVFREVANDYGAGIPPGLPGDPQTGVLYDDDCSHIDMAVFGQQIRAMRQWMKNRGEQNKPLIISEYGVIYKHPTCDGEPMGSARVVQDFMVRTFDYFFTEKDCDIGFPGDECRLVHELQFHGVALQPGVAGVYGDRHCVSGLLPHSS